MDFKLLSMVTVITTTIFFAACNDQNTSAGKADKEMPAAGKTSEPRVKEDSVAYKDGGITFKGFVAYDENTAGARPAVLVIPEWWGLNDYVRNRARQLAALGYMAMAADMYGEGKIAADPKEAMALATPFYKDPQLAKTRLDLAMNKLKHYEQTDTGNIAAIGYCYGGYVVLNAAKLGADLKGVVSFHGGLGGAKADKNLLKASVLVCHGGADKFESQEEIDNFKRGMDSIKADYTFKVYPNATHAFTNPDATATGKKFNMPIEYNAAADTASWNDMKVFLTRILRK